MPSGDNVGYYCGRIGDGFWGEPLNAASNIAYLIVAAIAISLWVHRGRQDWRQLALALMVALIGVSSFIFHTNPTRFTLMLDLIPVQIFTISFIFYLVVVTFRARVSTVVLCCVAFFVVRQLWILGVPPWWIGGGITHIPALVVMLFSALYHLKKKNAIGRYLLVAFCSYTGALIFRTLDLPLCASFPLGLHFMWHIMGAITAGTLLLGVICATERTGDGTGY